MPEEVTFPSLDTRIAELLNVSWITRPFSTYTLHFDTANTVTVTRSFAGHFSSPYAGKKHLIRSAPETTSLAHDFLNFLAQKSELTIPDLADDDPLFPFIVSIVRADEAEDVLFKVLTDHAEDDKVNLEAALDELRAKAEAEEDELLLGAEAWEIAEVQRRDQLAQLLEKLATDDDLRLAAKVELRKYKWQHVVHDHRHYLLFGQNEKHITPKSWFNAAWKFIEHFHCNFGMFVTEAMLYDKVTIIGADNAPRPVSREDQEFLEKYTGDIVRHVEKEDGTIEEERQPWRQVERLNVVNAQQLADLLEDRIKRDVRFEGGEVTSLA